MEETSVQATSGQGRTALIVAVAGLLLIVLHATSMMGPLDDLTFVIVALAAMVGTVVGLVRWKPSPRWPWVVVVCAMVVFIITGWARLAYGSFGNLTETRSLVPELLALAGYALVGTALIGFVRARSRARSRDIDAVLDAILAGLAALALAWVFLVIPALGTSNSPIGIRLLLACFPPMSVFLVVLSARIGFSQNGRRGLSLTIFLVALVCMLIGDAVYMVADLQLLTVPAAFLDVPYACAFILLTIAVVHPSMREITEPLPPAADAPRPGRLLIVAVALCIPAAVIMTRVPAIHVSDRIILAVVVGLLTATAVWRTYRALREHAHAIDRLAHQASHDPLTGLPNRNVIEHELEAGARVSTDGLALLLLDIDRFKLVNDSLGHGMGDDLLKAVGKRLRYTAEPEHTVARVGGDEFAVIVRGEASEAEVLDVAERTRLALAAPFRVREIEIPVSASVGVARPGTGVNIAEEMIRDADTAMYRAKDHGGNEVRLFDESMREGVRERLAIEGELRHALERRQLSVHYQPVVTTADSRVVGYEALLRWQHPGLGSIRPDVFIPIAEDTGLIVEIGAWVLDEACRDLNVLREQVPKAELWMAVNLSPRQLRDSTLIDHVARALVQHHIPSTALCLELTESELMENLSTSTRVLATLRDCGVMVAVDDFGTGYSSFAYLRHLPVDKVKIDRSFVNDLGEGGAAVSMVAAIVAIAGSLGLSPVAEGVEDAQQAAALHELGCGHAQGFWYAKPMPFDEVLEMTKTLGVSSDRRMRIVPDTA